MCHIVSAKYGFAEVEVPETLLLSLHSCRCHCFEGPIYDWEETSCAFKLSNQDVYTEEEVMAKINHFEVDFGALIVTKSTSRTGRVAEALGIEMIGVNVGYLSACESPFGGESKV